MGSQYRIAIKASGITGAVNRSDIEDYCFKALGLRGISCVQDSDVFRLTAENASIDDWPGILRDVRGLLTGHGGNAAVFVSVVALS